MPGVTKRFRKCHNQRLPGVLPFNTPPFRCFPRLAAINDIPNGAAMPQRHAYTLRFAIRFENNLTGSALHMKDRLLCVDCRHTHIVFGAHIQIKYIQR
jgi:hypothetical protein